MIVLDTSVLVDSLSGSGGSAPTLRQVIKRQVAAWLRRHIQVHTVDVGAFRAGAPTGDQVIDAQVIETKVEDAG